MREDNGEAFDAGTGRADLYERLAGLLEYPDETWRGGLELCLKGALAAGLDGLDEFDRKLDGLSLPELQERYTQTFDLNPVCTLEVGYHLFGENYKRGIFLAKLRETEAPFELGQQRQLPDYLPVLLRLLVRLDDKELRTTLIVQCMLPALEKMIEALAQAENPYGTLLSSIRDLLAAEVPDSEVQVAVQQFADQTAIPGLYQISSSTVAKW
jgi:nitrate reductase delta subunit